MGDWIHSCPGPGTLPRPDAAAQAHSLALERLIRDEIAAHGGPIPFARFMELVLYAPGLGYYSAGAHKLGREGDFVTAPEISPLFARCIARQCAQVLDQLGGGVLLELGAGTGALAAELLPALAELGHLPERYLILEVSADLRDRQRQALEQRAPRLAARAHWLDALPSEPVCGVMLANEVVDALPIHRFRIEPDGLAEYHVAWEDGRFVWHTATPDPALGAAVAELQGQLPEPLPVGYTSEMSLLARPWLRALADTLGTGAILLIDYGFPRAELYHPQRDQGTLMCHYRHRAHSDPLILVGLQDITAHVDFTALAEAGAEAGLQVSGYTAQAPFLLACGLLELAAGQHATDTRTQLDLARQVKLLTLPSEMGELFKVLALTRGVNAPLFGFALADRRSRL